MNLENFRLFKENFKKNNDGFPDTRFDDVCYITLEDNSKIIGVLAYGLPNVLSTYRKNRDDEEHLGFAHIFDLEILENYRGNNLSRKLIDSCIRHIKRLHIPGITLMAKNEDLQHMYSEKYGFKVYKFRYMEKFVIGSEEIDWKEIKPGDVVVEGYLNLDPKYRTITSIDGKHWEYFEDGHYHSPLSLHLKRTTRSRR